MCVVEANYQYRGYRIVCLFMEGGFRCGYIGIRNKKPDNALIQCIRVHGGITYSKKHLPEQKPDGYWYIGFDCCHEPMDGRDIRTAEKYFSDRKDITDRLAVYPLDANFKTLDYVEEQCRKVIEQIKENENETDAAC